MRENNRAKDKLRKVKITRDYLKDAEGSCLIEMGATKVICSATVEENVPPFLRDSGTGWVTAEYGMLPRSCKSRINRDKISGRTYEIQRLIGRSLRSVVDFKELGERTIKIDCDVIQADGGTRTASITGSFVALADALDQLRNEGCFNQLPLKDFVAAVSVGIVKGEAYLDLTYHEDSKAEVDMNVVLVSDGSIVEVQGTAEEKTFTKKQMDELFALAKKGIEELIDLQRNSLKNIF